MSERYFDKNALFKMLGYTPHPGQVPVHASTALRRVVACGVRWGKTKSSAMEGIAAAMQPAERSVGWVCAPTYDLSERVFNEICYIVTEKMKHRVVTYKPHEYRLVLRNMSGGLSEIRGKSADNPVSLLGEGLDWLIVDEAARLKPGTWESHLSQRLIDKRGWAMLISTPKGKGFFYSLFRRGLLKEPGYECWNQPSWTNPRLDRELIEQQRMQIPDRVFRQEYGAEFIEGSGSVFRNVQESAIGDWMDPIPGMKYYAGLDLAKVEDFTVLTILDANRQMVHCDRFNRLDWNIQLNRIGGTLARYGNPKVLVDSTGAGEPIYEALRHAGCKAVPYTFSMRSKAALIDNLSMMMENQEIILPKPHLWTEGLEEMESFEYSVTDSGNVKSGSPSGAHDDCVISLALAAWQAKHRSRVSQMLSIRGF